MMRLCGDGDASSYPHAVVSLSAGRDSGKDPCAEDCSLCSDSTTCLAQGSCRCQPRFHEWRLVCRG